MQNLFNESDRQLLLQRLQQLSITSHRQWGVLSVEEMVWHLRMQLEFALGKQKRELVLNSYLRFPPLRWLALYLVPWPKGSATAPQMNVKKVNPTVGGLDQEREALLRCLDEVLAAPSLNPHPLFGIMNKPLWGRLIWKHIDHHLRQFGN
jgi:hypothetical protein